MLYELSRFWKKQIYMNHQGKAWFYQKLQIDLTIDHKRF